jgi:hypothetical protein
MAARSGASIPALGSKRLMTSPRSRAWSRPRASLLRARSSKAVLEALEWLKVFHSLRIWSSWWVVKVLMA